MWPWRRGRAVGMPPQGELPPGAQQLRGVGFRVNAEQRVVVARRVCVHALIFL